MSSAEHVRVAHDVLDPGQARRLAALLGLDDVLPVDDVPPLWHWVYFLGSVPQSAIGADGHPASEVPTAPGPGFKRMFAGGRAQFHRPLRYGEPSTRRVRLLRQATKQGRSGLLTFATVEVEVLQATAVAVTEQQDIVYLRSEPAATPKRPEPSPPTTDERAVLSLDVDATLLFRFSALTYNAHRIHYDLAYARSEGHADLVVHGPLQALLLSEATRRCRDGPLVQFDYILRAPAYGAQKMTAYTDGAGGYVLRDGAHQMTATATARW